MFYAIQPTSPAVFLIQPDSAETSDAKRTALLLDLSRYFMSAVALVWWDATGQFATGGHPCTEAQASSDMLTWRKFMLPATTEELPF